MGCSGGAKGDPEDDIGDIRVLTHSPGNGDELDTQDSLDGFNALNNPTLTNPGAVTIVFTNSLLRVSVVNPDPTDPQGTRNVRLFYFDPNQGPFDDQAPRVPGANPPGANVLVQATSVLTSTAVPNDTLIIRPTAFNNVPFSPSAPLPEGQYSAIVELGVRGADGDGMIGQEYFFFFRVGQDNLGPVVVSSDPAPGEQNVDPETEIRVTMSETLLGSTVNPGTLSVSYQPSGATIPISIPGSWFTDGGNGPGNNFPAVQLDFDGIPNRSGTSARNGADLVFRPDLEAFPVNMTAHDPNDPACAGLFTNPPRKGNQGFPLGQSVTVAFVTAGIGVTDTAGNPIPTGSPNTTFTFETRPQALPVFAPGTSGAVYFADTLGIGAIDINVNRTPYFPGTNPRRAPDSIVTAGTGVAQSVVRVPVPDLQNMRTDTRPYTAFYSFACPSPFPPPPPSIFMGMLYAASASLGGGQVVVIDTYRMTPLGRFGTPSPGGLALTAIGTQGRLLVSNFSANTATVFDIGTLGWFTLTGNPVLPAFQVGLAAQVGPGSTGAIQLILTEEDFTAAFPAQRGGVASPPGPPVIGTILTGIGPADVAITGLNNSLGLFDGLFCFSPILTNDPIVAIMNTGESTADFTHLTNLSQEAAIIPDLAGVNLSSEPTDVTWATWSINTGAYYFTITAVGGTVELFSTGRLAGSPSVKPNSSAVLAPNQIVSSLSGLENPTDIQWATSGVGVGIDIGPYRASWLVTETGANTIRQVALTAENPSFLFQSVNENHPSGLGPVSVAGDPGSGMFFSLPCTPTYVEYYVANAGEGTVTRANYLGGASGAEISAGGVLQVASWWTR